MKKVERNLEILTEEKISNFQLTSQQRLAVNTLDRDVLVTAGAGSGKTRTLVARYLGLLENGLSPKAWAAITFTEKAAREMRNRVRSEIYRKIQESKAPDERSRWQDLHAQLDAARIGTIHSLCAEILRTHPVEARVDPDFEVVEEGLAAMLRVQAVDDALLIALGDPTTAPIFHRFTTNALFRLIHFLLEHRLEAMAFLDDPRAMEKSWARVLKAFRSFEGEDAIVEAIMELKSLEAEGALVDDAGDRLASQIESFLEGWSQFEGDLKREDTFEAAAALFILRKEHMGLKFGKRQSRAKACLRQIRERCDLQITPWLGGKTAGELPPDEEVERDIQQEFTRILKLFTYARAAYRAALDSRFGLDFDDLEEKALDLLQQEEIRKTWQALLMGVMVDEFQDTNERQRKIVQALLGSAGRLFVVGDARQSIYRFRGADVTVFKQMHEEVNASGGLSVELDMTFRAHPGLLNVFDDLLPAIMEGDDIKEAVYRIPYTPMRPFRETHREGVNKPYVEVVCGIGASSNEARPIAARALVQRLIQLREEGQIQRWDDVALLFRASTGFPSYEDAFEAMGVPFVTVAGRGFYDRPEIRDVLNMLQALADPSDDLALAGLLRSPAFGLTDEALYRLRCSGREQYVLWDSLRGDLGMLDPEDRLHAERAVEILEKLTPQADRLPVAELLKQLMDQTDYRAILASAHNRLLRNLDKLLQDAHMSELVRVRAFLDYVHSLRDVGAREGEAPVDVDGSVRLMTIHKAKGLQFEIVVLADASRGPGGGYQPAYLTPEIGLAVKPDRLEAVPLVTRLARWIDKQEAEAEADRLLYVALTRAQEKILISGHLTQTQRGLRSAGWLKDLLEAIEVEAVSLDDSLNVWHSVQLPGAESVGIWLQEESKRVAPALEMDPEWPDSSELSLFQPLAVKERDQLDPEEDIDPRRDWRATGRSCSCAGCSRGQHCA